MLRLMLKVQNRALDDAGHSNCFIQRGSFIIAIDLAVTRSTSLVLNRSPSGCLRDRRKWQLDRVLEKISTNGPKL